MRRRRGAAAILALCAVLAAVVAATSSSGTSTSRHAAHIASAPRPSRPGDVAIAPAAHPHRRSHPVAQRTPAGPDPGSLPQTEQLPSSETARFRTLMGDLWEGIATNSVARALPAFFPLRAYEQLKAIGSPESDWKNRLVGDYGLDIAAAHRLLGADAASAQLVAVHVVGSYAHWVPPGACYNSVGYFEVPNARILYRVAGQVRSFGIASLISWRGVWYVVHLGAILRSGEEGVVDEPSAGAGESAYSGTC